MATESDVLRIFLPEGPAGSLDRLRRLFPGATLSATTLCVPLADQSPEAVLALCLRLGVTARGTTISARHQPR